MKLSEEDAVLCDTLTFDIRYLTLSEVEEDLQDTCSRCGWEIEKTHDPRNTLFAYKITAKEGETSVIYLLEYYHSSKGNKLICNVSDRDVSAIAKERKKGACNIKRKLIRCLYREMMKLYEIV